MKLKFGAIVTGGSGAIGGQVVTKNRAGYALRTKVTPSNPRTNYQANVRSRLTSISQGWAGLTEAQRTQWNNAVSSFQKTNIFGDKVSPSGFNLYQMLNNNLSGISQALIIVPPAPGSVGSVSSLSAVADNSSNSLTLTFSPAIDAGTIMKVLATEAIPAGKSFVKNKFRVVGTMSSTDVSPFVASTIYNAKFGAIGAVGKKIYVQVVGVNKTTGQKGIAAECVCTIQA